jgi:thioredoxin reductase
LDERALLIGRLQALGVKIMTHTRMLSIEPDAVNLQSGIEIFGFTADTVVLCLGARPVNSLEKEIRDLVPHVFTVGDAVRPRKVTEATLEGALAGLGLSRDAAQDQPVAAVAAGF